MKDPLKFKTRVPYYPPRFLSRSLTHCRLSNSSLLLSAPPPTLLQASKPPRKATLFSLSTRCPSLQLSDGNYNLADAIYAVHLQSTRIENDVHHSRFKWSFTCQFNLADAIYRQFQIISLTFASLIK